MIGLSFVYIIFFYYVFLLSKHKPQMLWVVSFIPITYNFGRY